MATNVFVYDLETTGLSKTKDKIIEIYIYNISKNTCLHKLINPDKIIPSESTTIHGLTNMDLAKEPKFTEVIDDIIEFVGKDAYLISHNNDQFDKPFMIAEFEKAGKTIPKKWKFIDTLYLARLAYPELSNYKQDTLREMFNISNNGSHRANKDVKDLAIIYDNITKQLKLDNIKDIYYASKKFTFKKMPFGKHRNINLKKLPKDYVRWLISKGIINDKENNVLLRSFLKSGVLKHKI